MDRVFRNAGSSVNDQLAGFMVALSMLNALHWELAGLPRLPEGQ